jgi:hypothetical protein
MNRRKTVTLEKEKKLIQGNCVHHPERKAVVGCRHCGDFLCAECREAGRDGLCARCARSRADEGPAHRWERRPGPATFFGVIGGIIGSPGSFYTASPRGRGGWRAYLHAAGVLLLAAAAATLVNYLIGPASADEAARRVWLTSLWLVPVNLAGLLVVILADAAVCFALLRFYDREIGFQDSLRLVSYATASYIFYPVPVFGLPIAVIMALVFVGVGARRAYGLSIPRAVLVAVIPLLLRLLVVLALAGDRLSELWGG